MELEGVLMPGQGRSEGSRSSIRAGMRPVGVVVASATANDLGAINDIYNHYVESTAFTLDAEPKSMAWRREWFGSFAERGRHRLLVAKSNRRVIGFAASRAFQPRDAYDPSVQTSMNVLPDHVGRGVGSALYWALLRVLEGEDVHRVYAAITQPNPASERLHERFGFRRVGYLSEAGRKFGRYWDVAWYELAFPPDREGDPTRVIGTCAEDADVRDRGRSER